MFLGFSLIALRRTMQAFRPIPLVAIDTVDKWKTAYFSEQLHIQRLDNPNKGTEVLYPIRNVELFQGEKIKEPPTLYLVPSSNTVDTDYDAYLDPNLAKRYMEQELQYKRTKDIVGSSALTVGLITAGIALW